MDKIDIRDSRFKFEASHVAAARATSFLVTSGSVTVTRGFGFIPLDYHPTKHTNNAYSKA